MTEAKGAERISQRKQHSEEALWGPRKIHTFAQTAHRPALSTIQPPPTARCKGCQPFCKGQQKQKTKPIMTPLLIAFTPVIAAAGPAFLVWLFGGGFGLALLVFVVLKMMGK
jgi:hypothetical protein